jgi:hypothetical protein
LNGWLQTKALAEGDALKSGRDIGREHLGTLEAFLQSGAALPWGRDGSVNLSELAKVTGIPKSSFYQNPAVRSLVEGLRPAPIDQAPSAPSAPIASLSVGPSQAPDPSSVSAEERKRKAQRLERRVNGLEQQNAALVAENFELRRQLKDLKLQMGRQDMMIDTGRRIVDPSVDK